MMKKGRHHFQKNPDAARWQKMTGEDNPNAKLTAQEVMNIRREQGSSTQKSLATKYAVSEITIHRILNRRNWTHLSAIHDAGEGSPGGHVVATT